MEIIERITMSAGEEVKVNNNEPRIQINWEE